MTKKINITTKLGDNGTSRLFSGEIVSKTSLRLDAYGDLDELVSVLGLARYHTKKKRIKNEIFILQKELFIAGSELATTKEKLLKLPSRIDNAKLDEFEIRVKSLFDVTPIPKTFIVPGKVLSSSFLDVARTIARRCERKIVYLIEIKEIENKNLIVYMNRISDYLYLMARFEEGTPELLR